MTKLFGTFRLRTVSRLVFIFVVFSGPSLVVLSQTANPGSVQKPTSDVPVTQVDTPATRTSVDETFELNIDERRYTQESFEASTAVGIKTGQSLSLQIGVALASQRINVLMRNVRGSVRFRGTLERILVLFRNRQMPAPTIPSVVPPAPSASPSP